MSVDVYRCALTSMSMSCEKSASNSVRIGKAISGGVVIEAPTATLLQ